MKNKHDEAKKMFTRVTAENLESIKNSIREYLGDDVTNYVISEYAHSIGHNLGAKNIDGEVLKQNFFAITESAYEVLKAKCGEEQADSLFEVFVNNIYDGLRSDQAKTIGDIIEEVYES